ncbi:hypothetical protein DFH07DRAFT_41439 [Mycena maculata]|uniref:C3H1-type domain-containing protein n=1 Tax=Mycena maculata TaxID=230809 RepID=A0AAD7N1K6_9AGAR|nr:hypothetical protein DFH07DRAFT_41439 [Mycena maculata]
MDSEPASSQDYQNRIELGFDQLKSKSPSILSRTLTNQTSDDVYKFMNHEKSSQETIRKLENELSVYKLAISGLEAERDRFRKLQDETVKEVTFLKDQVKGHRVVTLIDGDGSIFSSDIIAQGQHGGHLAACSLSDSITQFLSTNYGAAPYQLWVYLFYNKRGLTDTFNRVGLGSLNKAYEDFVVGFNQATERFTMVDVGSMKEAADTKLRVYLDDDIRLPQTFKIIFGGCHDNGYASSLRSQMTAGFRDKLILLKGYTQMANAIAALDLPSLEIPDLFMPHKLAAGCRWMPASNQVVTDTDPILDESSPMLLGEPDETDSTGPSYSRVLQGAAPNREKSPREQSPSTEASGEASYTGFPGTRHIIPGIRLSKHKPPPCTLFYLSNCKHGTQCKYGHDYLMSEEHFQELRDNAKLGPCPMINRDEVCTWGDACCYGHYCPHSTKCPFYKLGKCKFRGVDMHRDPA